MENITMTPFIKTPRLTGRAGTVENLKVQFEPLFPGSCLRKFFSIQLDKASHWSEDTRVGR